MHPPKWTTYDDEHKLMYKKGNIILFQKSRSEMCQAYVEKYTSDYAVAYVTGSRKVKVPYDYILETYYDYFDFFAKFGRSPASKIYKMKRLREIYYLMQEIEHSDKHVPKSADFLKDTVFDYYWPADLGIKKGTEKPLTHFGNYITRVGYLGGKCFSNRVNTYDDLALPYDFNPFAGKEVSLCSWMYREKIDAIRTGRIKDLNEILKNQGIEEVDDKTFSLLRKDYKDYLDKLQETALNFYPVFYGFKGVIAPWYDSKGNLLLKGGATQYTTPLTGFNLERIGVLFVKKQGDEAQ